MASEVNSCPWEPINGFKSIFEFERFVVWMQETIEKGRAERVKVEKRYQGITSFNEEWFKHIESGTVWRLISPDFPFTGLFEKVSD